MTLEIHYNCIHRRWTSKYAAEYLEVWRGWMTYWIVDSPGNVGCRRPAAAPRLLGFTCFIPSLSQTNT